MKEIPERNTHFSHTIDFPFSTSWYYQVSKQLPGWGKFSTTLPNNSLLWIAKSRCCCCFWHYITHVCLISPYHKYVHTKAKSYLMFINYVTTSWRYHKHLLSILNFHAKNCLKVSDFSCQIKIHNFGHFWVQYNFWTKWRYSAQCVVAFQNWAPFFFWFPQVSSFDVITFKRGMRSDAGILSISSSTILLFGSLLVSSTVIVHTLLLVYCYPAALLQMSRICSSSLKPQRREERKMHNISWAVVVLICKVVWMPCHSRQQE